VAAATPAVLRLVGEGVIPWWIARPSDWNGEVILSQPHGQRSRCTLYVTAQEAVRRDLRGNETPLRRTADGDGFDIDLSAGETTAVRWR
jgi:hypothetical protein